jgi:hypothetical protein
MKMNKPISSVIEQIQHNTARLLTEPDCFIKTHARRLATQTPSYQVA